jgi:hypothetical protein
MGAWLALWKVLHYFTAGLGWPGWDQLGLPYLSRRSWPPVTTSRLSNSVPVIGGPVTPVSAVTRSGTRYSALQRVRSRPTATRGSP